MHSPNKQGSLGSTNETRQSAAAATIQAAVAQGVCHQIAEDERLDGRVIRLAGRELVNFGSCSYLGLETDRRLKLAACSAVMRYGTQFSSSRTYVSAPPYRELQELLGRMVEGAPVVVAPTTSLAHQSALPVLIQDCDAVTFDVQAHASMQAILPELQQRGIPCYPVRHGCLDRAEARIRKLSGKHRRVFYLSDGVYSMHGDVLNVSELHAVLDRNPQMVAYVDDAHAVGWCGQHGAGLALGNQRRHERLIVVLGLAKGFGSAGGVLVLPDEETARRVFTCGRTLIFSGPLPPAQLGASIASAKVHLSRELPRLQNGVRLRIRAFEAACARLGVPVAAPGASPIRFVPIGPEERSASLAGYLLQRGYYVNLASYPALPRGRSGLRVMMTNHLKLTDIEGLAHSIAAFLHDAEAPIAETPPPASGIRGRPMN